jgi:agmatine deiminase
MLIKREVMEVNTPKSMGFRFPAEWEPHAATWLTYPQNPESWPENFIEAQNEFNLFVKSICKAEIVHININNDKIQRTVEEALDRQGCKMENILFHTFRSDDCWCRDHGPVFLVNPNGDKAIVNSEFNAWGDKYPSVNDNRIASQITGFTGFMSFEPGIVIEGGSIEVNGNGTLLTTKACLLNKNRNPQLSQAEIEEYLRQYYCAEQILWLEDGIEGDDTDGHIDDIARFADSKTLLLAIEEDKKNCNYKTLKKNLIRAHKFRLFNDHKLEIVELPMPEPNYILDVPLPASYANYYVCNAGVIVPVFHCKQDQKALDVLERVFPYREIIPISAVNIIYGLGSWHCLSQQEPAV